VTGPPTAPARKTSAMPEPIELILARRSASPRRLVAPVPSADEVALLVRAAATAPDHKGLVPYRFIVVSEARRADLATAFRAAKRERDPGAGEEELARAGEKAWRGPMLLAVVLRLVRDHPRVSVSDQMITAGAAVQAMLLAAEALGYAGTLRSGASATSRTVSAALGLAPQEELAAFLMLGTRLEPAPRRPEPPAGLLTTW
jgi:nitroreductase